MAERPAGFAAGANTIASPPDRNKNGPGGPPPTVCPTRLGIY
jgi:hypothetical protein